MTKRALIQRINRALKPHGQQLKTSRGAYEPSLGDYYVVDVERNFIIDKGYHDVDLEKFARALEVLKPYEELATAEA